MLEPPLSPAPVGNMKRGIGGRIGVAARVTRVLHRAEPKSEALNSHVNRHPGPFMCVPELLADEHKKETE